MLNLTQLFSSAKEKEASNQIKWISPSKNIFRENSGIHVWRVKWSNFSWQDYLANLTEQEFNHILKYKNPKDRNKRALSRGILKELSASYLKTAPKVLNYGAGKFGKPFIADTGNYLQFNISHCTDYILLAFSFDAHAIGIDIEENNLQFDYLDIADLYFSNLEKQSLNCQFPSNQFFKIWTRKEAMTKALGIGLSDELIQIDVLKNEIYLEHHQFQKCFLKTYNFEEQYIFSLANFTSIEKITFLEY